MSDSPSHRRRELLTGLTFLAPNLLGVAVFTIFPVIISLFMAFSNWDLTQHNMFKEETPHFVGLNNVLEMFRSPQFWQYFGNTLFFMMGIPLSLIGSLCAAMLLSKDPRAGGGKPYLWLIATAVLVVACVMLTIAGAGGSAMTLLVVGAAGGILLGGIGGGLTFYRTLFYTPHFVAGVATYLLWKKLYSQQSGPINAGLQPMLDGVAATANAASPLFYVLAWGGVLLMLALFGLALRRFVRMRLDGELGASAAIPAMLFLWLPIAVAAFWSQAATFRWAVVIGAIVLTVYQLRVLVSTKDKFPVPSRSEGFGNALVLGLAAMVGQLVVLALASVAVHTPAMASDGVLAAPSWLNDTRFAKPALMVMGFWAAIGSNNMLLYLAALTNVPGELYEAADIDGARPFQRFWNVTWPQLGPTTFFILVMGIIGGLQGGFEMARTMTAGGPAGSTTTLSYYIYTEGFATGRLSFASAVAWILFMLIFGVTLFNWKFGNSYVND